MKRILSVLAVAFLLAYCFSIQSCQKCALCSYTYTDIQGNTKTFTYAEVCGNSNDVNDYKDACAAAAAAYTNGVCTCVDE
jgi:hypothetical protein